MTSSSLTSSSTGPPGRPQTYIDAGAAHVAFADPYCPTLLAPGAARDGGSMVVIEDPRFSTHAEPGWYAAQGWSLVNMTGHPEVVLARELGDVLRRHRRRHRSGRGRQGHWGVGDAGEGFAVFKENIERLRGLLSGVVAELPGAPGRLPEQPGRAGRPVRAP